MSGQGEKQRDTWLLHESCGRHHASLQHTYVSIVVLFAREDFDTARRSSGQVVELGFGPDDADMILRKAHGWKFQGYW